MSSKKRNDESQLPNEWEKIDQAVGGSGKFVEQNLNKILIAVAVLIVVFCGYLAYSHFIVAPKNIKAQEAMFQGEKYFRIGEDSLAIFGDGRGYIGFEEVIKEYGSTKAANAAKLYAAISYARLGKYDVALDYAKSFNSNDEILQYLVKGTIGDCLVNTGKMEEALPYFLDAAKGTNNMVQSPILYKKAGLVYRELGQYDKVIEVFSIIKNNYMNSPYAKEADKYIEEAKMKKGA